MHIFMLNLTISQYFALSLTNFLLIGVRLANYIKKLRINSELFYMQPIKQLGHNLSFHFCCIKISPAIDQYLSTHMPFLDRYQNQLLFPLFLFVWHHNLNKIGLMDSQ